ncbi:flagellin C-terminal helical region [Butyrivibrio fibrisolvens DSM 3071]|uniref:Flagellin n=1 Tax=Butyrivibrio fibrisolvens DSM 3071 TaxID=1121131 RepID=A0A1M5WDU6_BUTFI|nr:flagellin [Butyrivibrio fibrisolvens]SHH85568.1 flagellin C-terminal helical region [Butyrivibrio fibrisolvens DSM 3071]
MSGFVIQHNLAAMNSQRQYNLTADRNFKSAEKLSSGYKVNRAADDAAGLAISEKMRRQIRGLRQAEDNIQDGISFVQVADGALNETHDILQRMNELCVKASNDTLSDTDRSYINEEIQAIKKESDRIFNTTSFNDRNIWNIEIEDPVIVGHDNIQALNVADKDYTHHDIYPENKDYMPVPNTFIVSADATNGVKVSWTSFNGNTYSSDYISWEQLKADNYKYNISEHLSSYSGETLEQLKDYLDETIYMSVETTTATIEDYVKALNNAKLDVNFSQYATATFDSPSDTGGISASASINIYAKDSSSKASTNAYSFQSTSNDPFIEPVTTSGTNLTQISGNGTSDINTAKQSTTPWIFKFNMSGIGGVTAKSSSVTFYSTDSRPENEDVWWEYTNSWKTGTRILTHTATKGGNLAGVMEALTGSTGVLTQDNLGDTNVGGTVEINFSLTADTSFSSAGNSSRTDVGSMTITIPVTTSDTEQTILNKVNKALNPTTIIDLSHEGKDYFYWEAPEEKSSIVKVPVYGGQIGMIIQSGSEADNDIPIVYEKLNNGVLGIRNLEITDSASAQAAIDTLKGAFKIVNEQRSLFGAYQNRMEHAVLNDNNIRINTQDSESQIRDTDMAKEMVNYSLTNILKQSGESMLAQANQSKQGVMSLLQ